MKIIFLSLPLALLIAFSHSNTIKGQLARSKTLFFCDKFYDTWATLGKVPGGTEYPIIRWRDEWASEDGINLQERCQNVSRSFQEYYNRGLFRYVIPARDKKGHGIICVAQRKDGPCTGKLWTLRPTDNPDEVVKQLFGVLAHSTDPVNQSSGVYVDIEEAVPTP